MATLPSHVNGVTVEFAETVDKNVEQNLMDLKIASSIYGTRYKVKKMLSPLA